MKLNIQHPSIFFTGIAPREADETFLRIFIKHMIYRCHQLKMLKDSSILEGIDSIARGI